MAVHGNVDGYILTGDNPNLTVLPREAFTPADQIELTVRATNLPLRRAASFVGRESELARLDAALDAPGGVLVRAVHGLGGIGKTALTVHWAHTRGAAFDPLWWIAADSEAAVESGLVQLAVKLQSGLADALSSRALRDRAVQWLAAHEGWLIILDNVNDPEDIAPLLAELPHGRFLITSRRAYGWQGLAETVRLDALPAADSVELLARVVNQEGPRDLDGADALCAELGGLPLAIRQAGAYIAAAGITPRAYLALLAEHPAQMYRWSPEETELSATVARVWHITLERLARTPLAVEILRVLAWYAPYNIPRSLLDGMGTPPDVTTAIGRLATYSMINTYDGALDVHRMVQAVTRTPDPDDPFRQPADIDKARETAVARLLAALPGDDRSSEDRPVWRELVRHADALEEHTRLQPETDTETAMRLFDETGRFLLERRDFARAAVHLQRALRAGTRLLGAEDVFLLPTRDSLGHAIHQAGNTRLGLELLGRNHEISLRARGPGHRDTLHTLDSLARVLLDADEVERARAILTESLDMRTALLGHADPDTVSALNNLGNACRRLGDHRRALQLLQWALRDSIRLAGKEHPHTRTIRNNLARADLAAGNTDRALNLLRTNIRLSEDDGGPDHPSTLIARHALVSALLEAEQTPEAVELAERNLADSLRALGQDHLDTLAQRDSLAYAYEAAGRPELALPLFERLLRDSVRLLGGTHPTTVRARSNLALAYERAGETDRAIAVREDGTPKPRAAVTGAAPVIERVGIQQGGFGRCTYHVHRAPDRETALMYLRGTPVREERVYMIVETPEGNVGRDLVLIFDEATGEPLEYGPRPMLPTPLLSSTRCGWCECVVVPAAADAPRHEALEATGGGYRCPRCALLTCAFCAPEPGGGQSEGRGCRVCGSGLEPFAEGPLGLA